MTQATHARKYQKARFSGRWFLIWPSTVWCISEATKTLPTSFAFPCKLRVMNRVDIKTVQTYSTHSYANLCKNMKCPWNVHKFTTWPPTKKEGRFPYEHQMFQISSLIAMGPAKPNGWHPNGVESSGCQNLLKIQRVERVGHIKGATSSVTRISVFLVFCQTQICEQKRLTYGSRKCSMLSSQLEKNH